MPEGQKYMNINIDNSDPDWWDEHLKKHFGAYTPNNSDGDCGHFCSMTKNSYITMYKKNIKDSTSYTEFEYGATVSHELGHTLGLDDDYPGAHFGKRLASNAEISEGQQFAVDGSIMYKNGKVYSNDIEMVLEAFRTNEWQWAMDLDDYFIKKSRVIRLPQIIN